MEQAEIRVKHRQKSETRQVRLRGDPETESARTQIKWGDMAQEVRAVVWQSGGCRFDPTLGVEVSLSKTPNPQLLLTSWLVPCMAANCHWCVNVSVNG